MGWDQYTSAESVQQFLLRLVEIDVDKLLMDALTAELAKKGITYKVNEGGSDADGDGKVTLSDGREFILECTSETLYDDVGYDHYTYVEKGKEYEKVVEYPEAEDNNVVTVKRIAGEKG